MASVTFEHARIDVDGATVLTDVSLDVADGDFVGVIGPSGSGKTTLLRAVAGFASVAAGRLLIDGVDQAGVKVAARDVGMVFQQPALFGNRSVGRNVSFPLELRHQPAVEISRRVGAEARALHVEHLLARRPGSLSRGEAQLVQIARTMVRTPRVLLLDEPLASLDEVTRRRMRVEMRMLQEGYGVTTLMATNDPDDAMRMPNRLAVLHDGQIVQVAPPEVVHHSPATLEAALATGECWTVPVRVERDSDGFWLVRQRAAGDGFRHRAWSPRLAEWVGAEVVMTLRPRDVTIFASDAESDTGSGTGYGAYGAVTGLVTRFVPGQPALAICDVAGRTVGVHASEPVRIGDRVRLRIDHAVVFDADRGLAIA